MVKICRKDCKNCRKASFRVDSLGYPFGIECLKYKDAISLQQIKQEKRFTINDLV